jgi:cobalamin biosynthesis protein CobT
MKKDLRNYMGQVKNESLLPILDMAFESPHAYMAFRKILEKDPAELSRFLDDRDQLIKSRIDEWLSANGFNHDANFENPLDDISEDNEDEDYDDDDGDGEDDDEKDANDFSPGRP